MLVKDRMSRPVITVYPDTTMQEALEIMRHEHIRRIPVIDKRGQLIGIITENDLDRASPSSATTLSKWEIRDLVSKVKVETIMTRDIVTIEEDTPIEEAARIMADCHLSGLPVMSKGKLVGLITESDLFKLFLELMGGRKTGVRLTVEVPITPGELAKLTRTIYESGGDIVALGTYLGESSESGRIVAKVSGVPKEKLLEAIRPVVTTIIDIREN